MSSVLIVCATVVLIVALCLGAYLYVTISERKQKANYAADVQRLAHAQVADHIETTAKLEAALNRLSEAEKTLQKQREEHIFYLESWADNLAISFKTESKTTADAILAFSERMVVFEAALKAAIAEMVNATGYSAAKYQELIAAQVRRGNTPGKKQGVPA